MAADEGVELSEENEDEVEVEQVDNRVEARSIANSSTTLRRSTTTSRNMTRNAKKNPKKLRFKSKKSPKAKMGMNKTGKRMTNLKRNSLRPLHQDRSSSGIPPQGQGTGEEP